MNTLDGAGKMNCGISKKRTNPSHTPAPPPSPPTPAQSSSVRRSFETSAGVERFSDAPHVDAELRRVHHVERTRARQVDLEHVLDLAGPRGHHQHAVAEEHGLARRMGDEDDRLFALHPDALQLDIHRLA